MLKKDMDTRVDIKMVTVVRESAIHNNYHPSNLIGPHHVLGISTRDSTLVTRPGRSVATQLETESWLEAMGTQ